MPGPCHFLFDFTTTGKKKESNTDQCYSSREAPPHYRTWKEGTTIEQPWTVLALIHQQTNTATVFTLVAERNGFIIAMAPATELYKGISALFWCYSKVFSEAFCVYSFFLWFRNSWDSKEGFPQQLSQPRAPPSQPSGGLVGVCARHDFNSLPCRSVPDNELMRTFYHKKNYTYTSLSSIIALYKIVYHWNSSILPTNIMLLS